MIFAARTPKRRVGKSTVSYVIDSYSVEKRPRAVVRSHLGGRQRVARGGEGGGEWPAAATVKAAAATAATATAATAATATAAHAPPQTSQRFPKRVLGKHQDGFFSAGVSKLPHKAHREALRRSSRHGRLKTSLSSSKGSLERFFSVKASQNFPKQHIGKLQDEFGEKNVS